VSSYLLTLPIAYSDFSTVPDCTAASQAKFSADVATALGLTQVRRNNQGCDCALPSPAIHQSEGISSQGKEVTEKSVAEHSCPGSGSILSYCEEA
jgi:hypothetical protein